MANRPVAYGISFPVNGMIATSRGGSTDIDLYRIDFSGKADNGRFLKWCEEWGDVYSFKEVEYLQKSSWPAYHEFIRLSCIRKKSEPISCSDSDNLVLYLERTADPKHVGNAITGAEAADWLAECTQGSPTDTERLQTSFRLLKITFSDERTLSEVLDTCYRIATHRKSRDYILFRFNCYFFCWNIILGLSRPLAQYESTLYREKQAIVDQLTEHLKSFGRCSDQRFNLALVLSGHWAYTEHRSEVVDSPFMNMLLMGLSSESFHTALRENFTSTLWNQEQETAITRAVKQLIKSVASSSVPLLLAGTGKSFNALFFSGEYIDLNIPPTWTPTVDRERDALFKIYLNGAIWDLFGRAMAQTDRTQRQKNESNQVGRRLTPAKSVQYSQSVLIQRLAPLGLATLSKNASVAYSLDRDPEASPIARAARKATKYAEQYDLLTQVAGSFVSLTRAQLENRTSEDGGFDMGGLIGINARKLIVDLVLDADLETLSPVAEPLIESVKRMARNHEDWDYATLRKATIKLIADVRTRGCELSFYPEPMMVWELILWYSLSDGIIKSIRRVTERLRSQEITHNFELAKSVSLVEGESSLDKTMHKCERAEPDVVNPTTASTEKLSNSQIQDWILIRVRTLCRMLYRGKVGLGDPSQLEIQETMSEIWQDQGTWYSALKQFQQARREQKSREQESLSSGLDLSPD